MVPNRAVKTERVDSRLGLINQHSLKKRPMYNGSTDNYQRLFTEHSKCMYCGEIYLAGPFE